MEEREIIYKGKAVIKKNPKQTMLSLMGVALVWAIIFIFAKYLPASWIFELGAIILSAVLINKILKKGTFESTYILYSDTLEVVTRYGLIEKVSAIYPLSDAVFTNNTVTAHKKTHPFYPDNELKKLLKIEITS